MSHCPRSVIEDFVKSIYGHANIMDENIIDNEYEKLIKRLEYIKNTELPHLIKEMNNFWKNDKEKH